MPRLTTTLASRPPPTLPNLFGSPTFFLMGRLQVLCYGLDPLLTILLLLQHLVKFRFLQSFLKAVNSFYPNFVGEMPRKASTANLSCTSSSSAAFSANSLTSLAISPKQLPFALLPLSVFQAADFGLSSPKYFLSSALACLH